MQGGETADMGYLFWIDRKHYFVTDYQNASNLFQGSYARLPPQAHLIAKHGYAMQLAYRFSSVYTYYEQSLLSVRNT